MTEYRLANISIESIMDLIKDRDPDQLEFHQAVYEVMESLVPFIHQNKKYQNLGLLERLLEPERTFISGYPGRTIKVFIGLIGVIVYNLTVHWGLIRAGFVFIPRLI